jgi:hypothetical protein
MVVSIETRKGERDDINIMCFLLIIRLEERLLLPTVKKVSLVQIWHMNNLVVK